MAFPQGSAFSAICCRIVQNQLRYAYYIIVPAPPPHDNSLRMRITPKWVRHHKDFFIIMIDKRMTIGSDRVQMQQLTDNGKIEWWAVADQQT